MHVMLLDMALKLRHFIETKLIIGPGLLYANFTYYAFEQFSKKSSIMLNIMSITTKIIPEIIYNFILLITILV